LQCPHIPEMEQQAFSDKLRAGPRAPYGGMIEITSRCNNRCAHCYVPPRDAAAEQDALSTQFLLRLLDVLFEEQCIWLTFTGGEPLIRDDFPAVYEAAKRRGFVVAVFTNATLLTDEIADLFYELPPRLVSISLYGSTPEVYERVSRVPGSFEAAMAGINRVKERGLNAHLKTMALQSNHEDLPNLRAFAEQLGWHFHFDTGVNPRLDRATGVFRERLDPETAVALDTDTDERRPQWRESFERYPRVESRRIYDCNAGRISFAVDSRGGLLTCIVNRLPRWQLDERDFAGSFKRAFYEQMPHVLVEEAQGDFPCGRCPIRTLCPTCLAWRALEAGDPTLPVEWGCRVAVARAKAIGLADISCPGLDGNELT